MAHADTDKDTGVVDGVNLGAITTASLSNLQSNDERKILDVVDKLRRTGLSGIVELPQLVVCGDQSSGKSSVLEAITQIPFPRKENLCTRFATEIILRRSARPTISITITPDKLRPTPEQDRLRTFSRALKDFSQFPHIIDEATEEMGLGAVGGIGSKAFSRDVLSVEISGPDRPQLTLVDLPGLIHTATKAQSESDKELIFNLVKEYMKNPRTIILAVISAKNDYANQVILEYCRQVDKEGRRTLGIITKPDYLKAGSENELSWIELAQNKDVFLERGWHILKNRSESEMDFTFEQRNSAENLFFSQGRYLDLPRECAGIETLRVRLSNVLLKHLTNELPSLRREIIVMLKDTNDNIEKLGEKRDTVKEQQMILMKISTEINNIIRSASCGHYDLPFFGKINKTTPIDDDSNIHRFRAIVQHFNIMFATTMLRSGHKYNFAPATESENLGKGEDEQEQEFDDYFAKPRVPDGELAEPVTLHRKQALRWAKQTLERSRGSELPGTFQPMLISELFWEQSEPWKGLALAHVENVATACKCFIYTVVKEVAPAQFADEIIAFGVDGALEASLTNAKVELDKLLDDNARPPCTYNHYFTTSIQKMRQDKFQKLVETATEGATEPLLGRGEVRSIINPSKLQTAMNKAIQQDMDALSCEDALNVQQAYYKDRLKYFIDAVTTAVIERHLVNPLADRIFSPLVVTRMTDEEISLIAAESPEMSHQRALLEKKRVMLEKGLATFRAIVGHKR